MEDARDEGVSVKLSKDGYARARTLVQQLRAEGVSVLAPEDRDRVLSRMAGRRGMSVTLILEVALESFEQRCGRAKGGR